MKSTLLSLLLFLFSTISFTAQSQENTQTFLIVNADNGLVWDMDSGYNGHSNVCEIVLAPKSGRRSQLWRITEKQGFITIANVAAGRIICADNDSVWMNMSLFPTGTNYLKPAKTKDGAYVLFGSAYVGLSDSLAVVNTTLQPNGKKLRLASEDGIPVVKESWLFIPVQDDVLKNILNSDKVSKLTPEDAKQFNEKIKHE
ncbi:MAG: hypothetical protein JST21_16595 [Bacteroidetes bacterium]|nr:hypothetical protein [Bacteroidota bacterium]